MERGIFTLGKVLNFFPVGGERECHTSRGNTVAKSGICINPYDCRQRDGKPAGDCAHGLGVCCVFEVTCGGVVQHNISYFISPGFPELWPADRDCNITIEKAYAGITQLRVDFVHFNIGQPNRSSGDCDQDVMILGGDPKPFRLCGQNHGQHIYHTLSTALESRDEDLASSASTVLSIRPRGGFNPRLWMLKLSQMPLAYAAPHDCLQYFTGDQGTITTFNYAVNGRYLAGHEYRVCVKKNTGFCAIRYQPCDDQSFRIGPGLQQNLQNPVEEDMMPVGSDPVEDMIEGSGDQVEQESQVEQPSMATRIWRLIWPSWLWGQRSRARTWGRWSPYSQHYSNRVEDDFVYQGYGKFGDGLKGFGRLRCQDRITIPCENEYFLTEIQGGPGVCDPHHCGPSFCPGLPSSSCEVHSSISPFQVSMHFGEPQSKGNPEENIGACLMYSQVPCGS